MPCTRQGPHWPVRDAPEVTLEAGASSPIAPHGSEERGLSGPVKDPPRAMHGHRDPEPLRVQTPVSAQGPAALSCPPPP